MFLKSFRLIIHHIKRIIISTFFCGNFFFLSDSKPPNTPIHFLISSHLCPFYLKTSLPLFFSFRQGKRRRSTSDVVAILFQTSFLSIMYQTRNGYQSAYDDKYEFDPLPKKIRQTDDDKVHFQTYDYKSKTDCPSSHSRQSAGTFTMDIDRLAKNDIAKLSILPQSQTQVHFFYRIQSKIM